MAMEGRGSPSATAPAEPFRALAETTPDAIITADASNRMLFANPAAEQLLGYAAAELVGQPVTMIVPEEQRSAHLAGFERFVRTREPRLVGTTVAVNVRRSDGTLVPVELSLGVAGSADDTTLTAVIRDVSERVRHQRHVAAQLAVTQILTGPDTPDQEARIVESLTASLGWDVGALWLVEATHLRPVELWQAEPAATATFAEATRGSRFRLGEGAPGMAWQSARPVWLEEALRAHNFPRAAAATADGIATGVVLPLVTEGSVIGVLELFSRRKEPLDDDLRDVLATVASQVGESLRRQQHAADLARSNADLEQFALVVAHDLAEPLRTIAGFAQLLERRGGEGSPEEAAEMVATIHTSAQRGQQILDSVLHLARIGTGTLERAPVDLGALADDVVGGLQAMIEAHAARIDVAPLPTVTGDATMLGQLLQNLLANAMKFRTEAPPHVRVSAGEDQDAWTIDVADNGRGITGGKDVFELFTRAGAPGEVGLGVGLAVCQKVVERHGGAIRFESTPGAGTTFSFTLPKAPAS